VNNNNARKWSGTSSAVTEQRSSLQVESGPSVAAHLAGCGWMVAGRGYGLRPVQFDCQREIK
ncbi:hypothetical protein ONA70_21945, partial [Micromonospora yasonensis]|uniref:hypothetical protein n=1 Tax=Micromonospora yasonensis TaxID=1128667 RepID=UPI002230216F